MAAPFEVGVLALYFPSFVSVGPDQLGISLHPSGFALVLPAAIVGVAAGLGAVSVRSVRATVGNSIIRGLSRASVAIAIGVLVTAVIAGLWLAVELLTQASVGSSSTGGSISPAAQDLGWSIVALIPFYIGNVACLTWTATLAGTLFADAPLHPLIYIGPVAGVFLGSLLLSHRPDRAEQGSYAASIAIVTAIVSAATSPAILNGSSLVPLGWTGFVVALVLGMVAALSGPYLQSWRPLKAVAGHAPITWLSRPFLAISPRVIDQPIQAEVAPGSFALPSIRLGRTQIIIAAALVALVVGGLVGNAQLTAQFSPEAAALNYLTAEGHDDAATMWSMVTYESNSPTTTSLLSEDALKKMLSYGPNTDLKNITVSDSARIDDANYSVTVSLSRGGIATTTRLHVQRDSGRSNWLFYPFWRVIVPASDLLITTFLHAGQVTIDGLSAGLADQGGTVEVIPGDHDVALAPTDIFAGDDRQVDASNSTTVTFKALLTAAASTAVNSAITKLFAQCSAVQQLAPAGCPNRAYALGDHQSNVRWTLVGDPTANMQLSIADQSDTIEARGNWDMHISYDYWYDFDSTYVEHWDEDVTGIFDDTLHWNGSSFDITNQGGF